METPRQKIVFLNHWASRMGGAEYSLLDMLSYAVKRWECHLVSVEGGKLHDRAMSMGVHCHVLPLNGNIEKIRRKNILRSMIFLQNGIFGFLAWTLRLRRLVKQINPALIHANVPKSHMALCVLKKTGYRGPAVFHMREIFADSGIVPFLYNLMFPKNRAFVIAISRAVDESLTGKLNKNCEIIHNGVRIPHRTERVPNNGRLRLLYLGRIVPWKGCHKLIKILEIARRKHGNNISLCLAGDTLYWPQEYRQWIARLIREKQLDDCCELLPNTDDIDKLFSRHDILVHAAGNEPFGRTVAEAQARGLPVIAFDSGGISEIVNHRETGILVPHKDIEAFAEAIGSFVQNPGQITIMGDKGRMRAEEMFNVDKQMPLICDFVAKAMC